MKLDPPTRTRPKNAEKSVGSAEVGLPAMGAPITVAAKICEKAKPGEVLVSHEMWNNAREFIDTGTFEEYRSDSMAESVYVATLQNVMRAV